MRPWTFGMALACLVSGPVVAQRAPEPPAVSRGAEMPLYGKANPGKPGDEMRAGENGEVRNVTYPTLTPVLPRPGTANGSAVIVAPGGAFMMLSMENEGWQIARALADKGVTAFVLKYRLNPTPRDDAAFKLTMLKLFTGAGGEDLKASLDPTNAIKDVGAALKLIRNRASEWKIDPARIGMIGFSAGAIASLTTTLEAEKDNDPSTTSPAFIGYVYGPMDTIAVPAKAPPLFAALAMDDPLFGNSNFEIVTSWRKAKRPVELHVYQQGGHGFGPGKPGTTNALLMPEFIAWLDMQGFTKRKP